MYDMMTIRMLSKISRRFGKAYERRRKLFTEIPANLVFQACISFYRCFETFGPPIRKILVYTGMLPCLALHGLNLRKCVSRSDLVLDADHALDFFYLMSLFRRASRFIAF